MKLSSVLKFVLILMLGGCSAPVITQVPQDLRFYHDRDHEGVRFVCWRSVEGGWQCSKYVKRICEYENVE